MINFLRPNGPPFLSQSTATSLATSACIKGIDVLASSGEPAASCIYRPVTLCLSWDGPRTRDLGGMFVASESSGGLRPTNRR
jgi:hypothetical protein